MLIKIVMQCFCFSVGISMPAVVPLMLCGLYLTGLMRMLDTFVLW